jgi:hypothetical protein
LSVNKKSFLLLDQFTFTCSLQVRELFLIKPIQNVNITVAGNRTQSNENGFILLEHPLIKGSYCFLCFFKKTVFLTLVIDEDYEFNLVMNDREEQMGEVIVTMNSKKQVQGITTIAPEVIRKFLAGIENILAARRKF